MVCKDPKPLRMIITDKRYEDLSNLHFIAHIPHTVAGDQLIAQLFRCIPDRSWLFKYGRVAMSFLLDQNLWQVNQFICNLIL